ncbi:MAG: hypothetical protein R3F62_30795 [Planctomycetota bacterium]
MAAEAGAEADASRRLRLARRLGLTLGQSADAPLPLLIGLDLVAAADEALAARGGPDAAGLTAEARRLRALERQPAPAAARGELGLLDGVAVPCGVWAAGFDPGPGLRLDRALTRSGALWALTCLALWGAAWGAWRGRRPVGACAARFSLGRGLLAVGLPHALAVGLLAGGLPVGAAALPAALAVVLGASGLGRWALDRALARRLGLAAGSALPAACLLLGGALVWGAPLGVFQLAGLGVQAGGLALVFVARRASRPGFAALRGRVALGCNALVLLGLCAGALPAARTERRAAAADVEAIYREVALDGGATWRGGAPQAALRALRP